MCEALRDGVLVRWKKNVPETFKTAEELARLDRGGMILEPRVGLFGGVVEVDFASLYPSLIVKHNISPETLDCRCCRGPGRMVPGTPFHTCADRDGLIPAVLRPVLQRRFYFKRMRGARPSRRPEYEQKQLILKWLLVTCFGYTGYKNARFGRIECHESITASSREVLLDAKELVEAAGYEVLHGIVDSLWMRPVSAAATAPEVVSERIGQLIGIDIDVEGVYKWIVFLPCKGANVGALNKYYGCLEDGTLKVRGIELRRRDTPEFLRMAQTDMLEVLRRADGPEGFREAVPEALRTLRRRADQLREGDVEPADLEPFRQGGGELHLVIDHQDAGVVRRQLRGPVCFIRHHHPPDYNRPNTLGNEMASRSGWPGSAVSTSSPPSPWASVVSEAIREASSSPGSRASSPDTTTRAPDSNPSQPTVIAEPLLDAARAISMQR